MGRIYRPIELRNNGGKEHVVAMIDSGADLTVIDGAVAERLGLAPVGQEEIEVANRERIFADLAWVHVVSPKDGIRARMLVGISGAPFDVEVDEIEMIIGIDFLQEQGVKLDFRRPAKRKARRT